MEIERLLASPPAGPLLGGLSWRPPSKGKHSMRRLYEARNLTTDATHYTLFQSGATTVYGLYQPRASEELARLPKGVLSAAHCFARRVGQEAPNAALILRVPAGGPRRDEKIYVVVLEDGAPVVDSLTTEMEARNALGSEDRPIWSDSPLSYPNCEPADFDWLALEPAKATRVMRIPMNPWPLLGLGCAVAVAATTWWLVQQANRAYEIADVRFRAGVSTQLELSDSRLLLQQAEANRALAARDLQVARARVALLPELPLAASAGTVQRTSAVQSSPQPQPQTQQQPGGTQFTSAAAQQRQPQTGTR